MRGQRAARNGNQDEPVARPVRVFHAEDINNRHRHHLRADDLPDPPLVRFRQRDPWGPGGTGLAVFLDTRDYQAAGSVGERRHIGGCIPLVPVRGAVHLRLEIKIERFGNLVTDQGHDRCVINLIKARPEKGFKPRGTESGHAPGCYGSPAQPGAVTDG